MLSLLLAATLGMATSTSPSAPPAPALKPTPTMVRTLDEANGGFMENKGQWNPRARYRMQAKGVTAWITKTGMAYAFEKESSENPSPLWGRGAGVRGDHANPTMRRTLSTPGGRGQGEGGWRTPPFPGRPLPSRTTHLVEVEFVGGNLSRLAPKDPKPGVAHFGARQGRKAATDVRRFGEIWAKNAWPNVDARLYQEEGRPRYDFLIRPEGKVESIRLRFKGAKNLRVLENGNLAYDTPFGTMEERALRADQDSKRVPVRYDVRGNEVTFRVGSCDPKKPLRIDPVVWSRYVGGANGDYIATIALLSDGSPVVAGWTDSSDLEERTNALRGGYDGFVTKLSSDGEKTLWSRYVGGGGQDQIYAIALLPDGSPVVAGWTFSSDLEERTNALKGGHNGFVSRLSSDGKRTLWSRYVGETKGLVAAVALLPDGSPVVAGTAPAPFDNEGFVAKLSSDGKKMLWNRHLGKGSDCGNALAILPDGSPIVAGRAFYGLEGNTNEPKGGNGDGFVARLSPDGNNILWSRYIGGTDWDVVTSVTLLPDGSPVAGGRTHSPELEGETNTYKGEIDGFVTSFSSDGKRTLWSRYIGGSGDDNVSGVALFPDGSLMLSGSTSSLNLESSTNALNAGIDGFLARISPDGKKAHWSRYVGGSRDDRIFALSLLPDDSPVVAGWTDSSDLEGSKNKGGFADAFVARLSEVYEDDTPGVQTATKTLFEEKPKAWDGKSEADGVLCDNLATTPVNDKDSLVLKPQAGYQTARIWGFVVDANGKRLPEDTWGEIRTMAGTLRYFPPDEFPGTGSKTKVYLRMHVEKIPGQRLTTKTAIPIVLARTPVVLVHGINSVPITWGHLPLDHPERPWVAIDHSRDQEGNGPVEAAASRLKFDISATLSLLRAGKFRIDTEFDADPGVLVKLRPYRFAAYDGLKLSAKRVDLVGWSYGGLVSRWYLGAKGNVASLDWYKRDSLSWDFGYDWLRQKISLRGAGVETLKYGGDVRKLVTLGTMWRGVPTCNWSNEILEVGGAQAPSLGKAPAQSGITLKKFLEVSSPAVKSRTAAQEVMAVESPWLRRLIYPDGGNVPRPFLGDVAYYAIAGDDDNYFDLTDIYKDLDSIEVSERKWFPYLMLEVRLNSTRAFSDGVVPIWSQQIPGGASEIVPYDHNDYPQQTKTQEVLLDRLDDSSLKTGEELNGAWSSSAAYVESGPRSNGIRYRFKFQDPNNMAPWPQSQLYKRIKGVGRIDAANVWATDRWRVEGQAGKIVWFWEPALPFTRIEIWQKTIAKDKLLRTIYPDSNEAKASRYERDAAAGNELETYAKIYLTLSTGSQVEREILIESKPTKAKAK